MPISFVFLSLIHLLIKPVDNCLLSVDNKVVLGITLTYPRDAALPQVLRYPREPTLYLVACITDYQWFSC